MPAAGSVAFSPGESAQTVTIDVVGDVLDEPDETFTINLSGAANATILDAIGTGTITDDDTLAAIPVRLSSGFSHNCAIDTTSGVRCWGDSAYGALGRGQHGRAEHG